jgi:hypothetical protein
LENCKKSKKGYYIFLILKNMKKYLLCGIAAVLLIAGAAVINVNLAKIGSFSSSLRLEDTEAMSREPDPPPPPPVPTVCSTQTTTNYTMIDSRWVNKTETLSCKNSGNDQLCAKGVRSYTCTGNYYTEIPSSANWSLTSTTVHEYTCASSGL